MGGGGGERIFLNKGAGVGGGRGGLITSVGIDFVSLFLLAQGCGLFVFKVVSDFEHFSLEELCVCVSVCLSVCLSIASDSLESIKVIIIKLSTVTASDRRMHHVLIILTLTSIQGHTYLNHENNKCSIISETVQAMVTGLL